MDPEGLANSGILVPWKKPTIGNGIGGRIPLNGGRSIYIGKNGNITPQRCNQGSSKQTRMQEEEWLNSQSKADSYKHSQTTRNRGRSSFADLIEAIGAGFGG